MNRMIAAASSARRRHERPRHDHELRGQWTRQHEPSSSAGTPATSPCRNGEFAPSTPAQTPSGTAPAPRSMRCGCRWHVPHREDDEQCTQQIDGAADEQRARPKPVGGGRVIQDMSLSSNDTIGARIVLPLTHETSRYNPASRRPVLCLFACMMLAVSMIAAARAQAHSHARRHLAHEARRRAAGEPRWPLDRGRRGRAAYDDNASSATCGSSTPRARIRAAG
jgi:hypothetical protein